jgi:acyl-[acyl carrier protein]--UDP-N-acetylglucosamine O-acyltransferase
MPASQQALGVIHSTSIVDPAARIPDSCRIGPYCVIGADVELGENCELISHVVLGSPMRMGNNNRVFPFTTLGLEPQDLKFKGEATRKSATITPFAKASPSIVAPQAVEASLALAAIA